MAVTGDHYCGKCKKKQRMEQCPVCKARGGNVQQMCRNSCNRNGWLCPVHGKNY